MTNGINGNATDWGVLSAVRQKLMEGAEKSLERVFLMIPPKAPLPFTHIEPEEITSHDTSDGMRALVKIQLALHGAHIVDLFALAEITRGLLDGGSLTLGPKSLGILKLTSQNIPSPIPGQHRIIHQKYTILVRGKI